MFSHVSVILITQGEGHDDTYCLIPCSLGVVCLKEEGSLCPRESLSGTFLSRGLCPGKSLSRASLCSSGASFQGGLCLGGLCPGRSLLREGLCPGKSLSRGSLSRTGLCAGGVLVQGGLCSGGVSVQGGFSVQGGSLSRGFCLLSNSLLECFLVTPRDTPLTDARDAPPPRGRVPRLTLSSGVQGFCAQLRFWRPFLDPRLRTRSETGQLSKIS